MKPPSIGIIPARAGSKRIKNKNIRMFSGYPIIKYSIDVALKSNCFNEIMVSTDSDSIEEISRKYDANIPFKRSNKNSDDNATLADVIEEVIENYKKINQEFEYFCCILPTAPFITIENIKKAYNLLIENKFDSVFSIVKYNYPIQRALHIDKGFIKMIHPENYEKRSQDLSDSYHDAGQFYWMKVSSFLEKRKLFTENSGAIVLDEIQVQDIDTEEDWELAEIKYSYLKQKKRL